MSMLKVYISARAEARTRYIYITKVWVYQTYVSVRCEYNKDTCQYVVKSGRE